MQREEILKRLAQIERELKKRRADDKLSGYNAGRKKHRKQLAFHKCKKRNRWVFGGNRSGKTECGAVECIWLARGIHPYKKNKKDVFAFGGVSTIGFKSCDQGREKFQGSSLDFVWFDEEPPRDVYEECLMRVMDKKGEIFGTMTPLKGKTFIYNEIYLNRRNNPEVWCEFMQWADNPFLSRAETELLEKSLDKTVLDSRKFGRFSQGAGLVYPEFDPAVHVIEPFDVPKEWQDCISIDPGLNNPLSAHWYCVDWDGNVYVVAEHFESGRDLDYHAQKIKSICADLGWKSDSGGRVYALIDSAANQRTLSGQKSVAELFRERGIMVDANVEKDVFSGVSRVKSFLKGSGGGKLYVFSDCVNMIEEFKTYCFGAGDMPVKRDDHCMDELRYYIMSRPRPPKKEEAQSAVLRDKLRRIKRGKTKRLD